MVIQKEKEMNWCGDLSYPGLGITGSSRFLPTPPGCLDGSGSGSGERRRPYIVATLIEIFTRAIVGAFPSLLLRPESPLSLHSSSPLYLPSSSSLLKLDLDWIEARSPPPSDYISRRVVISSNLSPNLLSRRPSSSNPHRRETRERKEIGETRERDRRERGKR
ncbi:hypothetical protein CRG98_044016 [Punica granatum]|uniref:Uncharacterized protein n=1 Tax=Punica granatum TaxID=22663 RepID=A0A2I0HV38_PUNGR|nr:hypothetical protein CRG98_044016 [Punica granatum]